MLGKNLEETVSGTILCQVTQHCSACQAGYENYPCLPGSSLVYKPSDCYRSSKIQHGVVPSWRWFGPHCRQWRHQLLHSLGLKQPALVALVHNSPDQLAGLWDPIPYPRPFHSVSHTPVVYFVQRFSKERNSW